MPPVSLMARNTVTRLSSSYMGRTMMRGAGEAFGMHYVGGRNLGFLGMGSNPMNAARRIGRAYAQEGLMGAGKFAGKIGFRALGVIGTAASIYQGYQEEGVWGAAKGAAESIAIGAAWHAASGLLANPVTWGVAAVALGGYGYYRAGEAAIKHRKKVRGVEMGGGMDDVIGSAGALTDRARALQALNSSGINGRMALGNEAMLAHSSYR